MTLMAGIDGGTLALQKELKCQINAVRAPPTHKNSFIWHPGRQTKADFVSASGP